jgi:hypothetical protein
MKNLGFHEYADGDGDDDDYNGQDIIEEVTNFVNVIYHNCKNFDISPDTVFIWIKDLFDCYSTENNSNSNSRSFSFIDDIEQEQLLPLEFKKSLDRTLDKDKMVNYNYQSDSNLSNSENFIHLNGNEGLSNKNEYEIPFISKISNFIAQSKKECFKIKNHKMNLEN